ncbi:FKBP-type peptidyl-prolyl cis-trans isomerase [Pedobacter foliorum]|uniref:FKBP-type peptidyl-prolyl cis-trans isomerase n=1 Tax=Pedobacter foliorum TaxID=2739058 RepID=UPI00156354AA|nr:FKBP-type peptidyl-prolyl cis-trans isomerase [Pedobacter foliorum]NRF39345.1 FKBP-type peptidyl-prolyl cis-trans isomerase [Pedobacter foliorum]
MLKKITSYTFILAGLILLNSCKKEYESIQSIDDTKIKDYISKNNITDAIEDPDKTGFYYQIITPGTGEFFKADGTADSVLYSLSIKSLLNGTTYYTTSAISNFGTYVGYASVFSYSSNVRLSIPCLRTVLQKLKPGGVARILLPSYLAFGKNGSTALNVPSNENIELTVTTYPQKSQRLLDDKRITDFLASKGLTATKDQPTGVYYSVILPGTGDAPIDVSSSLKINYTGRDLGGTVFDSSTDGTFTTTLLQVISGWEVLKDIPGARKGAKIRLFIPSSEAYGTAGSTNASTGVVTIPPNACLDFDIEIVDVTN